MITIDSLINASPDSDLSKIDIIKMAQHLLDLTNPKNLRKQRIRSNERQVVCLCHYKKIFFNSDCDFFFFVE